MTKSVGDYSKKEFIKEELQTKILKCQRYPNLVCKLEKMTQRNFSFPCNLNPSNIPPPTANWKASPDFLPVVTNIFLIKLLEKKRGVMVNNGKYLRCCKAGRLYHLVVAPCFYGQQARSTIIYFEHSKPPRAHCYCSVGASGLCWA